MNSLPNIFAFCPTFGRPKCIANILEQWKRMDYPDDKRELIIVDDGDQYRALANQKFPGNAEIISLPRRFSCFGEKQNACASFSTSDHDMLVVVEDDDYLAPWTLRAHAKAFEDGPISIPKRWYLERQDGTLQLVLNKRQHNGHAAWAYSRDCFRRVNGYNWLNVPTDHHLWEAFRRKGFLFADPTETMNPYYICCRYRNEYEHLSSAHMGAGKNRWEEVAKLHDTTPVSEFPPWSMGDYERQLLATIHSLEVGI